jgi:hypothetical protein
MVGRQRVAPRVSSSTALAEKCVIKIVDLIERYNSGKVEKEVSRCTQFPESRLFVFNPSPGFNCIVTAVKTRTLALKTRTKKLLPKFVRDISTKMTPSFFRALVSVRDLSDERILCGVASGRN